MNAIDFDWSSQILSLLTLGALFLFVIGIPLTVYLSIGLSQSDKALITATTLGSIGTFLLAIATFLTVYLTTQQLKIQNKERERPLALEELSNLILPSIQSLKRTSNKLSKSETPGCTFDWVYVGDQGTGHIMGRPQKVLKHSGFPVLKLAEDDPELSDTLEEHDDYIEKIGTKAESIHDDLYPEINRLMGEEINNLESSPKVITSLVLAEAESIKESHELHEFWKEHGPHLIQYARTETDPTLDQIQKDEQDFREVVNNALDGLKDRKKKLKQKYAISDNEISDKTRLLD